jgi:hypothetical protein
MCGIAQPVQQRAVGLKARVRFSGISSFSFLLFSYVSLTSLCKMSLHSVLLMCYCLLIVHCLCNTANGHRPNCSW